MSWRKFYDEQDLREYFLDFVKKDEPKTEKVVLSDWKNRGCYPCHPIELSFPMIVRFHRESELTSGQPGGDCEYFNHYIEAMTEEEIDDLKEIFYNEL